jgi:hypothetical protein
MATFPPLSRKQWLGWLAVGLMAAFTSLWAFWGIIENFHEGWFYRSFWKNLVMMFGQYLSPMLVFMLPGLLAIYKPRWGAVLILTIGILAGWRFGSWLFFLPFAPLALLYWFGEMPARKWALLAQVALPLAVLVGFGIDPVYRVSKRYYEPAAGTLRIGEGIAAIVWAPPGPGWSQEPVSWVQASDRCARLSEDGSTLTDSAQHFWRLPTVEETVRSLNRHGKTIEGKWNGKTGQISFNTLPDKEPPLWETYSPIIYWWTSTQPDTASAYLVSYSGWVFKNKIRFRPGYYGFRAVRR